MSFEEFSIHWFKVGFDYFPRVFQVHELRNGNLRLVNVKTGEVLFDNLDFSQITVNGSPIENAEQLQEIVFNKHCECDLENSLPTPFKYFDLSFDESFE